MASFPSLTQPLSAPELVATGGEFDSGVAATFDPISHQPLLAAAETLSDATGEPLGVRIVEYRRTL